jgi:hypothetical protein
MEPAITGPAKAIFYYKPTRAPAPVTALAIRWPTLSA